jgi:hypothetical protein
VEKDALGCLHKAPIGEVVHIAGLFAQLFLPPTQTVAASRGCLRQGVIDSLPVNVNYDLAGNEESREV